MSENTTAAAVENNGEATEAQATKLYATKAECEANKPKDASKNLKPFEVSKGGTVLGWCWARWTEHAIAVAARLDGYTASVGTKTAPVTKETVAAKLATFSDEELAAMGLTRKPQKGKK
jgi:hypothetical protein